MSRTPVKSAPASGQTPDHPFDRKVVERAARLAERYRIEVRQDGGATYVGTVVGMPTVFGCGDSPDTASTKTREMLKWAIAYMLEQGRDPPEPA